MQVRTPNILLVEGVAECQCLREKLEAFGEVTVAENLQQALMRLGTGTFDVIFCAWDIRGGSWGDLMAAINDRIEDIPTVIYYHCGGENEWMKTLQSGAFDLLVPPFDDYKLTVLMEHALATSARRTQVA
jgi:DNA-binding NtrC family response regulator